MSKYCLFFSLSYTHVCIYFPQSALQIAPPLCCPFRRDYSTVATCSHSPLNAGSPVHHEKKHGPRFSVPKNNSCKSCRIKNSYSSTSSLLLAHRRCLLLLLRDHDAPLVLDVSVHDITDPSLDLGGVDVGLVLGAHGDVDVLAAVVDGRDGADKVLK